MAVPTNPAFPVYLVASPHPPGPRTTYFAMHDMTRLTRTSNTLLFAFTQKAHACSVARSLEDFRTKHGRFPDRHFTKRLRRPAWLKRTDKAPQQLHIVQMSLSQGMALVKNTGIDFCLVPDAYDLHTRVDVQFGFDRPAVCARLDHAFDSSFDTSH